MLLFLLALARLGSRLLLPRCTAARASVSRSHQRWTNAVPTKSVGRRDTSFHSHSRSFWPLKRLRCANMRKLASFLIQFPRVFWRMPQHPLADSPENSPIFTSYLDVDGLQVGYINPQFEPFQVRHWCFTVSLHWSILKCLRLQNPADWWQSKWLLLRLVMSRWQVSKVFDGVDDLGETERCEDFSDQFPPCLWTFPGLY